MLYEEPIKQGILDTLKDRVSSICDSVLALLEAGYIPNKNKTTLLNWSSILIQAYENIDVFSEEQHDKIDSLYNKVMSL